MSITHSIRLITAHGENDAERRSDFERQLTDLANEAQASQTPPAPPEDDDTPFVWTRKHFDLLEVDLPNLTALVRIESVTKSLPTRGEIKRVVDQMEAVFSPEADALLRSDDEAGPLGERKMVFDKVEPFDPAAEVPTLEQVAGGLGITDVQRIQDEEQAAQAPSEE